MSEIFDVDCGYLGTIQTTAERIWTDPIQKIDYEADVEAAKAVLENQQVNFTEITGPKKRQISIEWQTKCDITTQPCSEDCEIDGEDITPVCKPYDIECLRETSFKVPEREYRERTIDMQTAIAKNLLLHKAAMDEWLAQYMVTGIAANVGANQYIGGIGSVVGTTTTIAPASWDDYIWGYFNHVIRTNKFKSPYMLTGDNLYQYLFNRQHETMTEAGKAAMSKIGTIRKVYVDPENVEAIAPSTTFLLHKTAVAFVNKVWNPNGAFNAISKEGGKYQLWSEPSMNIPGIYYDIIMMQTCLNNEFYQAYKVQLHGVFAVNPNPCDDDVTGILEFVCGV